MSRSHSNSRGATGRVANCREESKPPTCTVIFSGQTSHHVLRRAFTLKNSKTCEELTETVAASQ